jgi:hypothetical protein
VDYCFTMQRLFWFGKPLAEITTGEKHEINGT